MSNSASGEARALYEERMRIQREIGPSARAQEIEALRDSALVAAKAWREELCSHDLGFGESLEQAKRNHRVILHTDQVVVSARVLLTVYSEMLQCKERLAEMSASGAVKWHIRNKAAAAAAALQERLSQLPPRQHLRLVDDGDDD